MATGFSFTKCTSRTSSAAGTEARSVDSRTAGDDPRPVTTACSTKQLQAGRAGQGRAVAGTHKTV
jgi:hypothetical protein